jgi:hypothetical protein
MKSTDKKEKKRKSANDYRKEFDDLTKGIKSLEEHTTFRLLQLAATYPDAIIDKMGDTEIKAGSCFNNSTYVINISIEKKINHIETIEKWLADQNPVKQKEIDFN